MVSNTCYIISYLFPLAFKVFLTDIGNCKKRSKRWNTILCLTYARLMQFDCGQRALNNLFFNCCLIEQIITIFREKEPIALGVADNTLQCFYLLSNIQKKYS